MLCPPGPLTWLKDEVRLFREVVFWPDGGYAVRYRLHSNWPYGQLRIPAKSYIELHYSQGEKNYGSRC